MSLSEIHLSDLDENELQTIRDLRYRNHENSDSDSDLSVRSLDNRFRENIIMAIAISNDELKAFCKTIPEYSHENGNLNEFIHAVDKIVSLFPGTFTITNPQRLLFNLYIVGKIKGLPKDFITSNNYDAFVPNNFNTWATIRAQLLTKFGEIRSEATLERILCSLTQKPNESFMDFHLRINLKLNELIQLTRLKNNQQPAVVEAQKQIYTNKALMTLKTGINQPYRDLLCSTSPDTMEDCVKRCSDYDNLMAHRKSLSYQSQNSRSQNVKHNPNYSQNFRNNPNRSQSQSYNKNLPQNSNSPSYHSQTYPRQSSENKPGFSGNVNNPQRRYNQTFNNSYRHPNSYPQPMSTSTTHSNNSRHQQNSYPEPMSTSTIQSNRQQHNHHNLELFDKNLDCEQSNFENSVNYHDDIQTSHDNFQTSDYNFQTSDYDFQTSDNDFQSSDYDFESQNFYTESHHQPPR